MAIELKRTKGSRTTPEQLEWLGALIDVGVKAIVAYGAGQAIQFIEEVKRSLKA